jgi:hypothetical protein
MTNEVRQQALARFKHRLDTQYYTTSHVDRCFCGCESFTVLSEQDRTGMDVISKLCMNCGLVHTDPRLSESCMAEFYEQDYYPIFFGTKGGTSRGR